MKKENKSLSEKITRETVYGGKHTSKRYIKAKYVKEFIKKLKEEFKCGTEVVVRLGNGDLNDAINKLAGEKLI